MRKFLLPVIFLAFSFSCFSQSSSEVRITGIEKETPFITFLEGYEKTHPVRFYFKPEWLEGFAVQPVHNNMSLQEAVASIIGGHLQVEERFGYAVIFTLNAKRVQKRNELLNQAEERQATVENTVIGNRSQQGQRKTVNLTGKIFSERGREVLKSTNVIIDGETVVNADSTGTYRVALTPGSHLVSFNASGHTEKIIDLEVFDNGKLDVTLEELPRVLQEIEISDQSISENQVGQTKLNLSNLKRAPTFLGERDIIKTIQQQPGVSTVGEAAPGFNVRGGSVDQNLVLYDGVPVFSTAHAFGLFTAFNSEAVKDVTLYKGGIPANYGGRASSVLDIESAEGNMKEWSAIGGIGIISSDLSLGGPIKKEKTSIYASVRSSYSDWMLDAVNSRYNLSKSNLSFYDGSLKLVHRLSAKTRLKLSGYTSFDQFSLINDSIYSNRNIAASVELDHVISSDFSVSLTAGFGSYNYNVEEPAYDNAAKLSYSITYPLVKLDFVKENGRHKINFGMQHVFYGFEPGELEPQNTDSDSRRIKMAKENASEHAVYLGDVMTVNERITIEPGIRLSAYLQRGPAVVYQYQQGEPLALRNIVDSTVYESGIVKTYTGIEPRFSVRYTLPGESFLKFGYNRMVQYLHLVTNTAAVAPVDIWQSSNTYFRPQFSDQISLGYYQKIFKGSVDVSTEVFVKQIDNVLDFKDGASLILNRNLETALLPGKAEAYGFEFSAAKNSGRFTGSMSYTYSRSFRQTTSEFAEETINDGERYPANFDQPHIVNAGWRYAISRRIFFSGNFAYRTGRPISLPEGAYSIGGVPIADFSKRNQYRIPDYHRVDVAFILEGSHKKKKLLDGTWVLSFYNVYSRRNAYSIFFVDTADGGVLTPYQLSVIGSIIPSISYRFKL